MGGMFRCEDVWGIMCLDICTNVRVFGFGLCWICGQVFGFRGVGGAWCGVSACRDVYGTVRVVCTRPPDGFQNCL